MVCRSLVTIHVGLGDSKKPEEKVRAPLPPPSPTPPRAGRRRPGVDLRPSATVARSSVAACLSSKVPRIRNKETKQHQPKGGSPHPIPSLAAARRAFSERDSRLQKGDAPRCAEIRR